MRKLATVFLAVAVHVLMGIGGAVADDDSKKRQQNPESIVNCGGSAGMYTVVAITTPEPINVEQCDPRAQSPCAPCIRSLENQGCKVLDLTVTEVIPIPTGGFIDPGAIFVLSCEKP